MGKISVYFSDDLDLDLDLEVRKQAEKEKKSLSAVIVDLMNKSFQESEYPKSFLGAFGELKGISFKAE